MSSARKIQLGFLLITFAPVVLGLLAWQGAIKTVDASRDLARTNEMVKKLEVLLSSVKDAEVAQREFIITGDDEYVRRIAASRKGIDAAIAELGTMRADERWLELLRTAIPQKFEEIDRTVNFRRSGDVDGAGNEILRNRGQQAMDDIRTIVRNMIAEENRLLDERSEAQQQNFVRTMMLFGFVLLLNVALVWSVFYLIQRDARTAIEANAELERRVALRTEELQRSNEDLQQFAYVASHDLKEPMRTISSYASLLERRYRGRLGEDANTYIGFIVDGVKRMNAFITDLLEYSRAGQSADEEVVRVDPQAVLRNVIESLKVTIQDAGASVTHDPLPPVMFDPMRLSQLLQNLIGNAIKYRAADVRPAIHVSAVTAGEEIVFSVRDNGPGVPPEHRETIFAIFKRLHGKEVEGTGIGLAMCRRIVERHGGRIWVESAAGRGSTFCFTVPDSHSAVTSSAAG